MSEDVKDCIFITIITILFCATFIGCFAFCCSDLAKSNAHNDTTDSSEKCVVKHYYAIYMYDENGKLNFVTDVADYRISGIDNQTITIWFNDGSSITTTLSNVIIKKWTEYCNE